MTKRKLVDVKRERFDSLSILRKFNVPHRHQRGAIVATLLDLAWDARDEESEKGKAAREELGQYADILIAEIDRAKKVGLKKSDYHGAWERLYEKHSLASRDVSENCLKVYMNHGSEILDRYGHPVLFDTFLRHMQKVKRT